MGGGGKKRGRKAEGELAKGGKEESKKEGGREGGREGEGGKSTSHVQISIPPQCMHSK